MSIDPALFRSAVIARAPLIDLDFRSSPMGVWTGSRNLDLSHFGLRNYLGMGRLAQVSGIEQAAGGQAPNVQLTLAGVGTDVLDKLQNTEAEVRGRRCTIRMGLWREQIYQNQPELMFAGFIVLGVGLMDKVAVRFARQEGETPGKSELRGDITLHIESLFASRRKSATESPYTDNDQQIRFPGDKGLEHAGTMTNKNYRWPRFIGDTAD